MAQDNLYEQAVVFYVGMAGERPLECFLELWRVGFTWKGRAVLLPLNIIGGLNMVRGKGKNEPKTAVKATWNTTFVDISLAGHSWEQIGAFFDTPTAVYDAAAGLLENGYRLGFTYNPQNDAFICSVTCKAVGNPNEGKTYTAFAASWFEALEVALYKHFVVAETIWSGEEAGANRPAFG